MSGADVLRDLRAKWAAYKTLPPSQRGRADSHAPTTAGTAYQLRNTPRFWQDVAHYMDLVLEQLERLTRRVEVVEAGPPPVPLVLPEEVEADLRYLQREVADLRLRLGGQDGLHARVVGLEYRETQPRGEVSGWVVGLTVVGAALSALCLVGCVAASLWVATTLHREAALEVGSPVGVVAPGGSTTHADGSEGVQGTAPLQRANTPREGRP